MMVIVGDGDNVGVGCGGGGVVDVGGDDGGSGSNVAGSGFFVVRFDGLNYCFGLNWGYFPMF